MTRSVFARSLVLIIAFSLTAAGTAGAWTHSPLTNLPVSIGALAQNGPQMTLDGSGGAIVVWSDGRNGAGTEDIYAQRVLASGVLDPTWPAGGLVVCNAANGQANPMIVTDSFGGAIVAWADGRSGVDTKVYARRVLISGVNDPSWPANGRALSGAGGNQLAQAIIPDGAGGAIVAWEDYRSGSADIYAMHVVANGALDGTWPANGAGVVTTTANQTGPVMISDYNGGAIVTWMDLRSGSPADVYSQHVLSTGAMDPAWPANGRVVFDATTYGIANPIVVTDGSSGAIVGITVFAPGASAGGVQHLLASGAIDATWPAGGRQIPVASTASALHALAPDWTGGAFAVLAEGLTSPTTDLTAHHVIANGNPDPAWPANGRALCRAVGNQLDAKCLYDFDGGGMFVAWRDFRSGGTGADVYAQRVLPSGIIDPAWPVDGRAVCTVANDQTSLAMMNDFAGGMMIAWADYRSGSSTTSDIYAQNITTFGVLGSPAPAIVSITDVTGDQGGHVRIRWNASQMDVAPYYEIGSYGIWRQVTASAAAQALAHGARLATPDGATTVERGVYRAVRAGAQTTWWEGVGLVSARGNAWYTYAAETFSDSSGAGNPLTTFFVEARANLQPGWWDSAPASGYSVDNLAPAMPAPFTGQYASGTAHLHWNPNVEHDLSGYRLYRGTSTSFVPGPGNLLAAVSDTGYADPAGTTYVYKLTAVDVHGNESPVATVNLAGPTGVGDGAPFELSFAAPLPNPASRLARLRYTLPRESTVRLAAYDAAGRVVREIGTGLRAAGVHDESWDLRDADGRAVGAGLYFVRLEVAGGAVLTRRIAVVR